MTTTRAGVHIHPTADVADSAQIGESTRIWHQAQIRDGAVIGSECNFGKGVFIDLGVRIGNRCKLQNYVCVFHGMNLEDGVFLGPSVILLNDKNPRAINADGSIKTDAQWEVSTGTIKYGAAIGGGSTVLPGVTVGRFALVGSGSVVTRDVPDHGVVYGNPARLRGFACEDAHVMTSGSERNGRMVMTCPTCSRTIEIPLDDFQKLVAR